MARHCRRIPALLVVLARFRRLWMVRALVCHELAFDGLTVEAGLV